MMKRMIVVALFCLMGTPALAQTAPKPAPKPAQKPRVSAPAPKPGTAAPARKPAAAAAAPAKRSPGGGPVVVLETSKGVIEFETYPNEAPKTVAHILALVKRNFYNGQRVHRVVKGFVIQFGDPQTRDVTKKDMWGRGPRAGSGKAVGVIEVPKDKAGRVIRPHLLGSVAMAHAGDATQADSQMYITMAPVPRLNGDYVVFGQVISGMDVVQKIEIGDMIKRARIKS